MNFFSETELFAKREEVWQQIEQQARKNNPQFENMIQKNMIYSMHQMRQSSPNPDDYNDSINEADMSREKIDQYSKEV